MELNEDREEQEHILEQELDAVSSNPFADPTRSAAPGDPFGNAFDGGDHGAPMGQNLMDVDVDLAGEEEPVTMKSFGFGRDILESDSRTAAAVAAGAMLGGPRKTDYSSFQRRVPQHEEHEQEIENPFANGTEDAFGKVRVLSSRGVCSWGDRLRGGPRRPPCGKFD